MTLSVHESDAIHSNQLIGSGARKPPLMLHVMENHRSDISPGN